MSDHTSNDGAVGRSYRGGRVSDCQVRRLVRIAENAERLYAMMPETCWMTETSMAKELGISKRQLRLAKDLLLRTARIKVTIEKNGRRANPRHFIQK